MNNEEPPEQTECTCGSSAIPSATASIDATINSSMFTIRLYIC